jgi:Ion transport protein
MVSFLFFIVLSQSFTIEERERFNSFVTFKFLSFLFLWILILRELCQLILSWRHYFKNVINWFEIVLILLAWIVLSDEINTYNYQRELRAVLILFAAFEFLNIIGNLPILSVSTHMVMLKRVTITFFKSIALYSILLLSFGLVFYSLYGEDRVLREKKPDDERNNIFVQIDTENEKRAIEDLKEANFSGISSRFGDFEGSGSSAPSSQSEIESDFKTFRTPMVAILRTLVMLTGKLIFLLKSKATLIMIIFDFPSNINRRVRCDRYGLELRRELHNFHAICFPYNNSII